MNRKQAIVESTIETTTQLNIPLSKLVASRRNPRRVKPQRQAHRQLVASIRAHGLLEPLIVQPVGDGCYRVIAGNHRLAALREVYRGQNPKIPCCVRKVDAQTADALALSENFCRTAMHPLDEAQAFARLAHVEAKGVSAIAAEFGVGEAYVRQRMKLATLAEAIQTAYRQNQIDTATAEAFAAVPLERQKALWLELGGQPRCAQQVRSLIAHEWIDAGQALFDIERLPQGTVSRDLFSQTVLVERKAFMEAQAEALLRRREALVEDGWNEVAIAPRNEAMERLWRMDPPQRQVDEATRRTLDQIEQQRQALEAQMEQAEQAEDEEGYIQVQEQYEALEERRRKIMDEIPPRYSEAVKAAGTVFLMLDPDGGVREEYRIPRPNHSTGTGGGDESGSTAQTPSVPTSDDLSERQLAATFTHQALAVRQALLDHPSARRRVLAMILHEKVRSQALAIRREANTTTLHADHEEGFTSPALETLRRARENLDPLQEAHSLEEVEAYQRLQQEQSERIDALIDLLTVECLIAHLSHPTPLVFHLARQLNVDMRAHWRPDARWLSGYKKIQLAHLIGQLRGAAYETAALNHKKSELVEQLDRLFADAAEERLDDPKLAERLSRWLPANLRPQESEESAQTKAEPENAAA